MNIIYNIITHPEKKINHLIENICRNILFSFEDGFARLTKILEKLHGNQFSSVQTPQNML